MTAFPLIQILSLNTERMKSLLMLLACLCTCACVGTWGGQKWMLGVFLNHSLCYVLRERVWIWSSPILLDWLSSHGLGSAGDCHPSCYCAGITDVSFCLWLFVRVPGPELRSSCLCDKHFTNLAISLSMNEEVVKDFAFLKGLFSLYVYRCLPACISVHHVSAMPADREGIRSFGTAIKDCGYVGAENQSQVLWKSYIIAPTH